MLSIDSRNELFVGTVTPPLAIVRVPAFSSPRPGTFSCYTQTGIVVLVLTFVILPRARKMHVLALCAAALLPAVHGLICNPRSHGAVGSGTVYDTDAVRAAVDECGAAGGGTVLFEIGFTFLTGAFNVSSNTRLQVEGTILGSPNATGYVLVEPLPWMGPTNAGVYEWSPFIQTWYANNVSIVGHGTIDGNGAPWWPCASNDSQAPCSGHSRPHGIRLVGGRGFEIAGVTIKDSPMWQVHPAFATDVYIHDVRILAPDSSRKTGPSHNTDGIDPDCSQDVLIERVYISTGDDNIAIKSGINWFGRTFGRPSRNITVRDSVFGTGHGMSIGSEMSGGVYDVLFQNISGDGMGTGIRIKSERGRGGVIANVTYRDIRLTNTGGQAVQFTMNYAPGLPPTNATATPALRNVTVSGLVSQASKDGWLLDGLPESPLENLTFNNVSITGAQTYISGCDYVGTAVCNGVAPSCPPCIKAARSADN